MTEPRFLVTVSFVHDVSLVFPVSGKSYYVASGEPAEFETGLTDYVWLAGLPGKIQWLAIPVTAFPSHSPH